jgi:hypothetical protein
MFTLINRTSLPIPIPTAQGVRRVAVVVAREA